MMRVKPLSACMLICFGSLAASGAQAQLFHLKKLKYPPASDPISQFPASPPSGPLAPSSADPSGMLTLHGTDLDYVLDPAALSSFGKASVAGDTLFFTPTGFKVQSSNGSGYNLASATLNITLVAHEGQDFGSLGLIEKGDYLLLGAGGSVGVSGQIRAFDLAAPLADQTASILPVGAMTTTGLPSVNWQAGATLDLSALQSAQSINLTMENLLLASTTTNASLAFAEKKFVGLTPVMFSEKISPVPEPQVYASMLAGLGLIGFGMRRRKA